MKLKVLPLWLAGTATTGLSGRYQRFCVASEGYRDLFVANGAPAERLAVTGIPNFDDCRRYERNDFPHRHFVLVCTSDARETFKRDDRREFIQRCLEIAAGRQLIFKLHPNENAARATREIAALAPRALVYSAGCAEEMIANCDALITQYSSTVFVGVALDKEVHSYNDLAEIRRLLPLQNRGAARNIAAVCSELLAATQAAAASAPASAGEAAVPASAAAAAGVPAAPGLAGGRSPAGSALPERWTAALLRLTAQSRLGRLATPAASPSGRRRRQVWRGGRMASLLRRSRRR